MQERYEALKLDRQLCFPLYAAARAVIRRYHPYLEALDLTYTQYLTMMVLWETDGRSVKELGERLMLDSGTLTPLLKSMEQKGLIRRRRSESDERSVTVSLTQAGWDLREQAADVPAQLGACIQLEEADAVALYTILYKLLGQLGEEAKQ